MQWWGVRSYPGDDAPPTASGSLNPNNRDGGMFEQARHFGEPLHHTIHTEGAPGEAWPGFDDGGEKVIHRYGPLLAGGGSTYQFGRLSIQRCLLAHLGGRAPLTNSNACNIANNLYYNLGRLPEPPATTGVGWRAEATEWGTGDSSLIQGLGWSGNWIGNVLVRGPQGGDTMPTVRPAGLGVPTGTTLITFRVVGALGADTAQSCDAIERVLNRWR